ncbi:hypothetical protein [Nonomuraea dietziae]|uniref:hypothetical protein n=1 Tax=Nonomuraea dietziae TaxID=65515 RepID=UPI0031D2F5AE
MTVGKLASPPPSWRAAGALLLLQALAFTAAVATVPTALAWRRASGRSERYGWACWWQAAR